MRRLIYLKVTYGEKSDAAFKQFKEDLKGLSYIKLIKEYAPKPEALVEFPDSRLDDAYEALRKLDIVAIIDSMLPKGEQ
jgi:hypothetical protein